MFSVARRRSVSVMSKLSIERLEDRITPSELGGHLADLGKDLVIASIHYSQIVNPEIIPISVGIQLGLTGFEGAAAAVATNSFIKDTESLYNHAIDGLSSEVAADALHLANDFGSLAFAVTRNEVGGLATDIFAVQFDIFNVLRDLSGTNEGENNIGGINIKSSSGSGEGNHHSSGLAAIVGTYSGILTPGLETNDQNGFAPRQVKLTINTDGTGSLNISPFESSSFSTTFSVTATQEDDGTLTLGFSSVSAGFYTIDMNVNDSLTNGNLLRFHFLQVADNTIASGGNLVSFNNFTLNKN